MYKYKRKKYRLSQLYNVLEKKRGRAIVKASVIKEFSEAVVNRIIDTIMSSTIRYFDLRPQKTAVPGGCRLISSWEGRVNHGDLKQN